MFKNLNESIFGNIGETLKKVSRVLFVPFVVIGIVLVIVGFIMFLTGLEHHSLFECIACSPDHPYWISSLETCYTGKIIVGIGFLANFMALVFLQTYALGEIAGSLKKTEDITKQTEEDETESDTCDEN